MRKSSILGMILLMLSIAIPSMGAMSSSQIRKNSRFLTDRMAYELQLSNVQYEDVYEINYDFLENVRYLMDDVARGIPHAVDRYYNCLDIRNDDLRWVLSNNQYRRFMNEDYFYRPIYAQNSRWQLRIYFVYTNVNFFYFGKPRHYSSYRGNHYRTHYNNISFYKNRYNQRYKHDIFRGNYSIRNDKRRYEEHKKHDFGPASKPSLSRPNGQKPSTSRPGSNSKPSTNRPESNNRPSTSRPESNNRPSTSRPESNNRPSTSRPESNNRPSTSRPESNSRPSTSRPESNSKPSTSRPESNSKPSTSRPNNSSSSNSRTSTSRSTKEKKESSSTSRTTREKQTEKESQGSRR
ncbi:MAG: hypothetical protein ACRC3Z_05400 [Phocaeicola sp.]